MAVTTDGDVRVGQRLEGFTLQAATPLPELRAVLYQAEHSGSGARLCHLAVDDNENLFSITLPTLPGDDTGAAHILEHAVLAGSRKYPVREPFFELIKMSMGTFINAFTGADYTCYPVASTVRQDLFNLADVYFDAVFHPQLTEVTFAREGHRLTPADPADPVGALTETGIVYNEMKGYYARPEVRLSGEAEAGLLPDTIYAHDSGGRPAAIPDLTYAGLRRFFATYYHPCCAFFFTSGDIPLREHLAFLNHRLGGFERRPVTPPIARQPRWSAPRRAEHEYQAPEGESLSQKTFLLLQWLCATATDPEDDVAFEVLDWILDGNEGAPLRRALVDSRLGQAPTHTGYRGIGAEGVYQVGLKGSEPDRAEAFERLVVQTLEGIAAADLPAARVEAAFDQAAYGRLEILSQYPLMLRWRLVEPWRLGADPLPFLAARKQLEDCRSRYRADPRYFNRLIQERLLDNPHRLLTVLRPSAEYQGRLDAAFAARMAATRARLSDEEVRRIAAASAQVEEAAGTPNPPEAVALLPQLRIGDVPPRPRHIPTTVERLGERVELLRNDVFSNGINYLSLSLDAAGLGPEQWAYVPRYADAIHKLGAAGMGYERIAERVAAATGGLHCGPALLRGVAAGGERQVQFSLKALDHQLAEALAVLGDLVFALDPRDPPRLQVVLDQALAAARTGLVNGGVGTALRYAAQGLHPEGRLLERMYGVPQLQLLERLNARYAELGDGVAAEILGIRDALLGTTRLTASFTGSDAAYAAVRRTLGEWAARLQARPRPAEAGGQAGERRRTGLVAPLDVAYCAEAFPAPHYTHPDSALLAVGAHLLTGDYLVPEIRFKGTAYGGSCSYDALSGQMSLLSWQDPHIVRTLRVFSDAQGWVEGAAWTQTDVDRAIIATLKGGERPIRPGEATGTALQRHLAGLTPEMRDARHTATLGASVDGVRRALAAALAQGRPEGSVCVLAGRRMLEEGNRQLAAAPLELRDVLSRG